MIIEIEKSFSFYINHIKYHEFISDNRKMKYIIYKGKRNSQPNKLYKKYYNWNYSIN